MIKIEKKECCGCSACMSICPKNAISMKYDEEGFAYPYIDKEKCIECNLCDKICSFKNYVNREKKENIEVYAVKHRDINVRMRSSSGGVYTAISEYILKNNGELVGAIFSNDMIVKHDFIENTTDIKKINGSKYVQSKMDGTYEKIKSSLQSGKKVLFSGTPCQVASLNRYLENINTENLLTIDLVCHGVPSPKLWKDYVKYVENKYKARMINFDFRHKEEKQQETKPCAYLDNGRIIKDNIDSIIYSSICFNGCAMRPSCHNCKYTNFNREGDITIGDFWGIEKSKPEFQDGKGISLVILNTNKGKEVFNKIDNSIIKEVSSVKDCIQHNLRFPTEPSKKREKFWRDYHKKGFKYIAKKYEQPSLKRMVIVRISMVLRKIGFYEKVKNIIKR